MRDRLTSLTFWAVFVAIISAVAYPTLQAVRDDDGQKQPQPLAARSTLPPHANAAFYPAAAFAPRPLPIAPARHWFSDTDFAFSGSWEHVRRHYDGRTNGTSSRSFHAGSRATLAFTGQSLRLYGVVGPRGGLGIVRIDGGVPQVVRFYAPEKSVHKLVYSSPPLRPGAHRLTISVLSNPTLQALRSRYVNIGGAGV